MASRNEQSVAANYVICKYYYLPVPKLLIYGLFQKRRVLAQDEVGTVELACDVALQRQLAGLQPMCACFIELFHNLSVVVLVVFRD